MPINSEHWASDDGPALDQAQAEQLVRDLCVDLPEDDVRHPVVKDVAPMLTHFGRGLDVLMLSALILQQEGDPHTMAHNRNWRKLLVESIYWYGFQAGRQAQQESDRLAHLF